MAPISTLVSPIIKASDFRTDFPEFADPSLYPEPAINYWLAVATILLDPTRWGTLLQLGVELMVAHEMVLEAQAISTAQVKGWPGISKGPVTSESPGSVSVNYDAAIALEEDGGNWNLTVYGSRFLRWARMAGMGPVQIGPGCFGAGSVPGTSTSAGWCGPNTKPGQSSFGQ